LGKTLTNGKVIHEEIKKRLQSGKVCYHLAHQLLYSSLLSKYKKITIYRILPVASYGSETWSLTLSGERRLRVFENRVLRRIFGPKKEDVTESGEDYVTTSFMICTPHQRLFGRSNQEE
jgi:hypothetical protein